MNRKTVLISSFLLSVLMIATSGTGLFLPGFYAIISENWLVQTVVQDMINLFLIAPVLLISSILVWDRFKFAKALWAGAVLYIIYTYVIYCFDVPFNKFFLEYCIILGLSFYLFAWFVHMELKVPDVKGFTSNVVRKGISIYLMAIAVIFYLLWLSEVIPCVAKNEIPKTLSDTGLVTNPVHVLDLSIILPGIFIAGFFSFRGNSKAFVFLNVFLSFFILMDLTIAGLSWIMLKKGLESSGAVVIIILALAAISAMALIIGSKYVSSSGSE